MDVSLHSPAMSQAHGLAQLLTFMSGHALVRSLSVVTELGIPDLLTSGPRTASTLASRAGVDEEYLFRILRTLAALGIFDHASEARTFGLNSVSEVLCTDHPQSLRDFVRLRGNDAYWRAWESLPVALRTGDVAFQHAHGVSHYDYLRQHPAMARLFNSGVRALTSQAADAIAAAYDFSSLRSILDVGGGEGILLAALLQMHSHLQGTLFELPQACDQARATIVAKGLGNRCEIIKGDFFAEKLPGGADCMMLSRVLHNWSDDDCVRILRACRTSLAQGRGLLVIEYLLGEGDAGLPAKLFDLQMLVYFGRARERSRLDYEALFAQTGFVLQRVIPTSSGLSILEAMAHE